MKLSDYIIKKISTYTNYAFTGQGGSVVHLNDSLSKNKKMKIIPAQNEQGASLAADAFYRTSGKLGVVIATSGPGILIHSREWLVHITTLFLAFIYLVLQ